MTPVGPGATWDRGVEKGQTCPVRAPGRGSSLPHRDYGSLVTLCPTGLASLRRARVSEQKAQGPSGPLGACWEKEANLGGPRPVCSSVKWEGKPLANPRAGLLHEACQGRDLT